MPHSPFRPVAVHPHAGGEHPIEFDSLGVERGSSPRGWGTLQAIPERGPSARFIPTRVGNTTAGHGRSLTPPVHPHAGGEHVPLRADIFSLSGSSPRGWGTRPSTSPQALHCRFIPTRVGNTPCGPTRWPNTPVHPHAGGEHVSAERCATSARGSSPRGWGTLPQSGGIDHGWRFIPTRVGNTPPTSPRPRRSPVHPHAGGEHIDGPTN